jgi:hypothetical protein
MQKLPPILTSFRYGKTQTPIPVLLDVHLTPVGTLDIGLKSAHTDHRWSLEFQVRGADGQDSVLLDQARKDEIIDQELQDAAQAIVTRAFIGEAKQGRLMEELEKVLGKARKDWPISLLRRIWKTLSGLALRRKTSLELECRWWNLAGYCLRPGYGYPLDDQCLKDLWKTTLGDFGPSKPQELWIQQLICFRRVAGGLSKGQQLQLANGILPALFAKRKGKENPYLASEQVRTLGALELIDLPLKIRVGEFLAGKIASGEGSSADFWALGRIGARHLAYGSIVNAVPRETVCGWLDRLVDGGIEASEELAFAFGMLARNADQRELQVPRGLIERILALFAGSPWEHRLKSLLLEENELTRAEQEQVIGDQLPPGLRI